LHIPQPWETKGLMSIPGSNIRVLRQQLGLSLKVLAKAADIDHGNLSRLERGEVGYSEDVIARIAKVLHVSIGVLFADTETVEAAALRMRNIPVLTGLELANWRGPGSIVLDDDRRHLHADLDSVSAHSFAVKVEDDANSPWIMPGDELIFDAGRQPEHNDIVIAHEPDGKLHIGRFRQVAQVASKLPRLEILPLNPHSPIASVRNLPGLIMRGTLAELRRYFPVH
jgi:transcriptional regulator with XRE-family HTH domain